MAEQVTRWLAKDGREFPTENGADDWGAYQAFLAELNRLVGYPETQSQGPSKHDIWKHRQALRTHMFPDEGHST